MSITITGEKARSIISDKEDETSIPSSSFSEVARCNRIHSSQNNVSTLCCIKIKGGIHLFTEESHTNSSGSSFFLFFFILFCSAFISFSA